MKPTIKIKADARGTQFNYLPPHKLRRILPILRSLVKILEHQTRRRKRKQTTK